MKTTSRLLAVLLSLVLLCSGLPFAFAEDATIVDSGTSGKLTWTLNSAGTLTITGNGKMNNYSGFDDQGSVYRTNAPWGQYYRTITEVIVSENVTSIGNCAFYGCNAITSINLSDTVTSIGYESFCACSSLDNITIPDSVIVIESEAFAGCVSLTKIIIGNHVTKIGQWAFSWCNKTSSILIPDSVTDIGGYAFGSPDTYQNLLLCNKNSYAASWAENHGQPYALLDGTDEDNTISETVNAKLSYSIDKRTRTLNVYNQGKLISFSSYNAPWRKYQQYVETAILSDGCTSVSEQAFYQCYNLKRVVLPETIETIDRRAFYCCFSLQEITIPDAVTSIGEWAFYKCSSLQNIVIPDSVTNMDFYIFEYCSSLQSVVIGDGLTSIGWYAFLDCTSLETVSIGENLTTIDISAFSGCSKLSTVLFGEKVQSIGQDAFAGCSSLPAVDLPASVRSIGARAFSDSALKDITIRNKNCSINKDAISIYATIHGYAGSTAETFADTYGYYFNEITDAAPHDHDRTLVKGYAATCTAAGLTDGYQCSVCGIWFEKQKPIKALGHDYLPVETQEPTDTKPGFVRYECTRCDSAYTETLPVTTHTHSFTETERKDATCLEDGYVTYTCAACGYTYTDLLVSPGHTFTPWSRFVMASDAAVAVEIRFCNTCGYYELRQAEKTDPGEDVTTPTDPTNPTDPTDPTDPTSQTDPTNPTDPTDPTNPTNPTNPTDPSEPVTEPTTEQQPEEEAPQGFFARIAAFFRNLFARLFGGRKK